MSPMDLIPALLLAALAAVTVFSGAVLLAALAQGRNPKVRAALAHGAFAFALLGLGFFEVLTLDAARRMLPAVALLAAGAALGLRLYRHYHRRGIALPRRGVLAHIGVALAGLALLLMLWPLPG